MQQQMPQPEQCGSQQQMQQVMLCPVQYVYEAPVVLPQSPENQMQQNQILINVKNPPPWIQNRPQNQVVYVQQMPNNYQPYIHPQMIQNPMYQPQMAYQIQPMMTQDNRQFIQIPNLNQYNIVQNPTQINNEETEKMPLLTQMLNQKANANNSQATNINNARPNMTPIANTIRPVTQNQQVQTDNVSPNIKGRPRNVPPQIITINPMQQRQLANQKQEAVINVRPTNIRHDVPQHIRTKVPSSISVKTINRPIIPRTVVRPIGSMPVSHNFYYNPIIMPTPSTAVKNVMTNTDTQYVKPNNLQEIYPRSTVPMQYQIPISNVPPFVNMTPPKNTENAQKNTANVNAVMSVRSMINPVKSQNDNDTKPITDTKILSSSESETNTEEKLVRNTVFVQARGRVLNDKEIIEKPNLKRALDETTEGLITEGIKQEIISTVKSTEDPINITKKIKLDVPNSKSETPAIIVNSVPTRLPMSIQTQQSRISNLLVDSDNVQKNILNTPQLNEISNKSTNSNITKSKLSEPIKDDKDLKQSNVHEAPKSEEKKVEDNIKTSSITLENKNNTVLKEDIKNVNKKEEKITVLTHVLEGYIIQESNVAFPIQKPMTEKEIKKERDSMTKYKNQKKITKTTKGGKANEIQDNKTNVPCKYLNSSIELEKEMEFSVANADDPFANVTKSTVESWTADQIASHLEKFKWAETAAKLLEEEIDGESILLVNKDQLVAIGVSEEHAEAISSFAAR